MRKTILTLIGVVSMMLLGGMLGVGAAEQVSSDTLSLNESESVTVDVQVTSPTNVSISITNVGDATETYTAGETVNSTQISDAGGEYLVTEEFETNQTADYTVTVNADNTTDINNTYVTKQGASEGAILGLGGESGDYLLIGVVALVAFVVYRGSDYEI